MSFHHENVLWQSPDGTWNRGFYPVDYYECGQGDDCEEAPEHEWCAVFDRTRFEWVSVGHATKDEAYRSWDGANPGSSDLCYYDPDRPESVEQVEYLEDMAAKKYEKATRRASESNGQAWVHSFSGGSYSNRWPQYWGYYGPARERSLKAIATDRNKVEKAGFGHRLAGYSVPAALVENRKALQAQVEKRLGTASDDEKRAFLATQKSRRDDLQAFLDKHRKERAKRARNQSRYNLGGRPLMSPETRRKIDEAEAAVERLIIAVDKARAEQEAKFFPPAPKKAAPAPQTRGKTTPKSNAGSFKAFVTPEADDVDLAPTPGPSAADPWDDIPLH